MNDLSQAWEDHRKWEILRFLERIFHNLKEIKVSQVQFNLTVNIVAAAPPLAEGSTSGSATFTQGEAGSFVLTPITGGVPPYTASVDSASPNQLPNGVSASIDGDNNLVLSGTTSDPVEAGVVVVIDIIDSQGNSVAKANVSVGKINAPKPPAIE